MKKILIATVLLVASTLALFLHQYRSAHDGKLHVVFCDVGQGDAVVIRTPAGTTIVYDGGPDQKIMECLTDNLPFWERTIDLMLLSHPHADHLVGLTALLKRYHVKSFDTERLINETAMYTGLLDLLKKQQTQIRYVLAGDTFTTTDGVQLRVLGPTAAYLKETSPGGTIGESKEFASLVMLLSYGDFDVLFTGDSQVRGLRDAGVGAGAVETLEVLQVPHHGSKTGLDQESIGALSPEMAVISVGENNYGHPNQELIRMLGQSGVKVVRTDKNGNIDFVSDGEQWWIE